MTAPATPSGAAARPVRRSGAFRCFPGSSRGRIQGLLGAHFPPLWAEIEQKWLPHARPIEPGHLDANGDYSRATLVDVLIGMGEGGRAWDGFDVCDTLKHFYGWQCDFHLAALIHAWSRELQAKLSSSP